MDIHKIVSAMTGPPRSPSGRLDATGRALAITMTALAVMVIMSLVWVSAVDPDAGSSALLDAHASGPLALMPGMTDWLLLAGCGAAGLAGIAILALDVQARKLASRCERRRLP